MELDTRTLTNSDDLPLRVDLRHDPGQEQRGLVVVCHGFKGFRRWGFFPWAGEQLAAAGWTSAVLDFSCNGVGEDPLEFDRLDLFERNTYGREVMDLAQVLGTLRDETGFSGPVGILAHSRASVPALVYAAGDPGVGAVVTWNGVARALRYTDRQMEEWEARGRLEFTNARTGQKMAISWDLAAEVLDDPGRFDPVRALSRMPAACLVLQAREDMAVPVRESEQFLGEREEGRRFRRMVIDGSTHTWGAKHPFEAETPALRRVLDLSLDWFGKHL